MQDKSPPNDSVSLRPPQNNNMACLCLRLLWKHTALVLVGLPLLIAGVLFAFRRSPFVIAGLIILTIFPAIYIFLHCKWRRSRYPHAERMPLLRRPTMPAKFRYQRLFRATYGFRSRIGCGTFGAVFEGTLDDGTRIAVKCLKDGNSQKNTATFDAEVRNVFGLNHPNLVRLLGVCSESPHRILVYEFMDKGSLDRWIFASSPDQRRRLDWKKRHTIALDTARALLYLHDDVRRCVLHLDIKPENILLDEGFRAKVSDFGLAKSLKRDIESWTTVSIRGTPGYMAPEWQNHGGITHKSDVFSYGIVVLEIICGRRCVDHSLGEEKWYLPSVAFRKARKGKFAELLDATLDAPEDSQTSVALFRLIKIALSCVQWNPSLRPSMGEIVSRINGAVPSDRPASLDQVSLDMP